MGTPNNTNKKALLAGLFYWYCLLSLVDESCCRVRKIGRIADFARTIIVRQEGERQGWCE
ncbi:hypothetical protein [Aquicella siphonis]|uniref:hypothetical protein n=1 Tax=Aquicella siphonis TaxID=254247 RepID=UPI0011DE2C53|nr:hypothetical protein [Aquicella siphonis]